MNSYYSQDVHGPFDVFDLGDFDLEDGGKIRSLQLAYATFGALSPNKDNAILFPTWYSGTSKILDCRAAPQTGPLSPCPPAPVFRSASRVPERWREKRETGRLRPVRSGRQ
jgi:homoserine acetyltransferase